MTNYSATFTDADESVSIETASAAAVEAPVCIDAVGVKTASAVVRCTLVDFYTIRRHQEHKCMSSAGLIKDFITTHPDNNIGKIVFVGPLVHD